MPHHLLCLLTSLLLLLPSVGLTGEKSAAEQVRDKEPIELNQPRYQELFAELRAVHGFSQKELDALFTGVNISRRVLELMDTQWEAKPYYQYEPLFVTRSSIKKGQEMMRRYRVLLEQIEQQFGVDREIVIAIWGIETRYGANQGGFNVFRTLNTLFAAYPRRSQFFRGQLIEFLLLCRENSVDPRQVKGSYAGAFGQTQFIPSSFRRYGVSFDGDTRVDVWNSVPDILASIANYLQQFGWVLDAPCAVDIGNELHDPRLVAAYHKGRNGHVSREVVMQSQGLEMPRSPAGLPLTIVGLKRDPKEKDTMRYLAGYPNFQAITAWNHSNSYAMAVSALGRAIASEH
ncbi:MAG: lytic transglycosylase [Desulfobulbus propionicus]|nr:MAG: lytic transglycosylase [Desulfobulbus propionicus]